MYVSSLLLSSENMCGTRPFNGVLNETWTHSCFQFKYICMCVEVFAVLKFKNSVVLFIMRIKDDKLGNWFKSSLNRAKSRIISNKKTKKKKKQGKYVGWRKKIMYWKLNQNNIKSEQTFSLFTETKYCLQYF